MAVSKQRSYTSYSVLWINPLLAGAEVTFWVGRVLFDLHTSGIRIEVWKREWVAEFGHKSPNRFGGIRIRRTKGYLTITKYIKHKIKKYLPHP